MRSTLLLTCMLAVGLCCTKKTDDDQSGDYVFVKFKLDNSVYSLSLPRYQPNETYILPYNLSDGSRQFLSVATFKFPSGMYFQCFLGYGKDSVGLHASREGTRVLAGVGMKEYDYLEGDFHPVLNKVEIHVLDSTGVFWSSTRQTWNNIGFTSREVSQPGGKFEVVDLKELKATGNNGPKFLVHANFECILYEGNGSRTKKLTEGETNFGL